MVGFGHITILIEIERKLFIGFNGKNKFKKYFLDIPLVGMDSLRHVILSSIFKSKEKVHKKPSIDNLIKINNQNHIRALSDISFSLEDGCRLGIIGHNGAGKLLF